MLEIKGLTAQILEHKIVFLKLAEYFLTMYTTKNKRY